MNRLFSQPLLTVNPIEMMKLWGELVECYYGVNKFGSDTAEIYAYRLMSYLPSIHSNALRDGSETKTKIQSDVNTLAANALVSLCEEFANEYDCQVKIFGMDLDKWLALVGDSFDHRAHVQVLRIQRPISESKL